MSVRRTQYLDLIHGRRHGPHHDALRAMLAGLAVLYRGLIGTRNLYYTLLSAARRRVNAPVISVGNITVGGTGKTPMAAHVAQMLVDRGRRPAILTRGYMGAAARADGSVERRMESDEALVLKRRCPGATIVIHPDRVAGARAAIEKGCDVMVLDDGFQHRRLERDIDLVLVDATAPFGLGRMLPRGLLREPVSALRRADLIALTRSDQIDPSDRMLLVSRLKRISGDKPILFAKHAIVGVEDVRGQPVASELTSIQAVVFAGIANFESFRRTVEELGVRVLAAYEYPDHHAYTQEELTGLVDVAQSLEANAVLTTEKDAVKIADDWDEAGCRLLVLRLEIAIDEEGERVLASAIDRVLATDRSAVRAAPQTNVGPSSLQSSRAADSPVLMEPNRAARHGDGA